MILKDYINEVRCAVTGISLEEFLAGRCEPDVLSCFDSLIKCMSETGSYAFGPLIVPEIVDRLAVTGNPWMRIREYCHRRLGNEMYYAGFVVEGILLVFNCESLGAWIDNTVFQQREPNLVFDDDELLVGSSDKITYSKEGILTPLHWIVYAPHVPGV